MTGALLNHLWQSTMFAVAAAALALAFRGNRAHVRHWIWVAASVKFLVPVALLVSAGSWMGQLVPRALPETLSSAPAWTDTARRLTEPFTTPAPPTTPATSPAGFDWLAIVAVAWAIGVVVLAVVRIRDWVRIRGAVRASARSEIRLADPRIDVRMSQDLMEPGVVGAWRPVLLLPAGIDTELTPAQLDAVLTHESCHVGRRDNLVALVHMAVETLFWFHPIVWWIGARLIEERERACDEAVLSLGAAPNDYAKGILRVCKRYVESPLACVAGVTGSDLKRRIEDIMENRIGSPLTVSRKIALAAALALAVAVPAGMGLLAAPIEPPTSVKVAANDVRQQSQPPAGFEVIVKVASDPQATAADKDKLVGKTFVGLVTIEAVRLEPQDVAKILALPPGTTSSTGATVGLRFTAKTPEIQQLRKGQSVRVRGTLTGFTTEKTVTWANFSDFVIEGTAR